MGRRKLELDHSRDLPLVGRQELLCSAIFVIHVQGKPVMNVTQRIGWDPLTKQIKSWVFDSDGGYGDALLDPQWQSVDHQVHGCLARRADGHGDQHAHANRPQHRPLGIDRTNRGWPDHPRPWRVGHGPQAPTTAIAAPAQINHLNIRGGSESAEPSGGSHDQI